MPTYDYECDACGHKFELFQNISENPKRKCPECGKLKLRRLFGTGAAIVFKGSGFYQTDYRSESYKKAASAEKKALSDKSKDAKGSNASTGGSSSSSADSSSGSSSKSSSSSSQGKASDT